MKASQHLHGYFFQLFGILMQLKKVELKVHSKLKTKQYQLVK